MTPHLTHHLTDLEFAALLAGEQEACGTGHLASCAACRAELAGMQSSILNFRVAVSGYAAAHVPASLSPRPAAPVQIWRRPRMAWAAGLVAAMAVGTVSLAVRHHPEDRTAATRTNPAERDATADARLLEDIDEDVSDAVPPSMQALTVPQTARHSALSTHN